jgi:hypothetical protein
MPVIMSPFSGPSGSPLDAKKAVYYDNLPGASGVAWSAPVADVDNLSTGALNTGIGFGLNDFDGFVDNQPGRILPDQNFVYHYIPGEFFPDGTTPAPDARFVAIGGGRSFATDIETIPDGSAPANPWNDQPLLAFGNGGSRDAGAGPAFTGFFMKLVTATAPVAVGAAVETGFVNRTSYQVDTGKSVFGSSTAAAPAPV